VVYSMVIRCIDQQFLLKPDHNPKQPLISAGCHVDCLDSRNDLIPEPSVINIIGAAAARAQKLSPIHIHWVEANINHLTIGFSVDADQIQNISDFFRNLHSYIAVKLNVKWERDGHLWGAPYRPTPCTDDVSASQQLIYCMTNPAKDGLVEKVGDSPFMTTYPALAQGKRLRFWRIDWDGYHHAGGARKKSHRIKDYLEWLELELTPLPEQEGWPEHKRRSWVRAQVRDVENETRERLKAEGRSAMGAAAQFRVDPRDRPKNPKKSGPQPLCHASSPEARREYKRRWREVLREHRAASIDYLLGYFEREFPEGTFRPPITKPYQSSRL